MERRQTNFFLREQWCWHLLETKSDGMQVCSTLALCFMYVILVDLSTHKAPRWCSWLSRGSHIHIEDDLFHLQSRGREFDPLSRHLLFCVFFVFRPDNPPSLLLPRSSRSHTASLPLLPTTSLPCGQSKIKVKSYMCLLCTP